MIKKLTTLFVCGMLAISAAMPLCGCMHTSNQERQIAEYDGFLWNDGDRSRNISNMTGQEREALVKNYLDYIGFDYGEYEFGYVSQSSNNNFSAESAFHCNVYKVLEDSFTVWLEPDGKTIDDRFMDTLNPLIQEYLAERIAAIYPEAKVDASAGMHRMPLKEWTAADGAENFLKSDENYVTIIHVFLPADSAPTQEEAETKMKQELGFLNDADFCFYKVENLEEIQPEELELEPADFRFTQLRDKS